jgi:predicted acyltransferase
MMLALLYFVVDVLGRKKWSLFARIYGSNAIAAYLVAEVLSDFLDWEWGGAAPGGAGASGGGSIHEWTIKELLQTGISPELLSFGWALAFCALCFIPIYVLYRKKIFLKI